MVSMVFPGFPMVSLMPCLLGLVLLPCLMCLIHSGEVIAMLGGSHGKSCRGGRCVPILFYIIQLLIYCTCTDIIQIQEKLMLNGLTTPKPDMYQALSWFSHLPIALLVSRRHTGMQAGQWPGEPQLPPKQIKVFTGCVFSSICGSWSLDQETMARNRYQLPFLEWLSSKNSFGYPPFTPNWYVPFQAQGTSLKDLHKFAKDKGWFQQFISLIQVHESSKNCQVKSSEVHEIINHR